MQAHIAAIHQAKRFRDYIKSPLLDEDACLSKALEGVRAVAEKGHIRPEDGEIELRKLVSKAIGRQFITLSRKVVTSQDGYDKLAMASLDTIKRGKRYEVEGALFEPSELADKKSPASDIEKTDTLAFVDRHARYHLTDIERKVLGAYLEATEFGYDHRTMAVSLGISDSGFNRALNRALTKIRERGVLLENYLKDTIDTHSMSKVIRR